MIERQELHDAARQAFGNEPIKSPREAAWKLAAELGWLLIPVPEEFGGLGLGREATTAIHYEMGRVLGTAPLLPALMTISALVAAEGFAGREAWIERAVGGELITTWFVLKGLSASGEEGAETVTGTVEGVIDADLAGHLLLVTAGHGVCALVPLDAPGVTLVERPLWDESRRLFDVVFQGVPIDQSLVLARGDAVEPIVRVLQGGMLTGLAADSLGLAEATLEMTVEYLNTRRQFDRPLAMFQALKHRCADMRTLISSTSALLWQRAANPEATTAELGALKALATDTARWVTEEAIQLHGGIGLTEEYPAHHFQKRALLNLQLGGSVDFWREIAGRAAVKRYAA